MINNDKKKNIINKICSSKTFSNAPTSIALLKYIFDASLKDIDLKESIIEIEFYGDRNEKKGNPKVRVNVYNLRKKLNQYYSSEGIKDEYKITIEKGQYKIKFEKQKNNSTLFQRIPYKVVVPYAIICLLVIPLLPKPAPSIWKSFFNSKNKTTLYIGDVFGMIGETITGNSGWTRDYNINNLNDYYTLCENNPELKNKLSPPPYSYLTQMGVKTAKHLQKLFSEYNHEYELRYTSKISVDDIKNGNAIYVGPIKNRNPFIQFFNTSNKHFNLVDTLLYFSDHPTLRDTIFPFPYRVYNEEYAIVSKIKGSNNTVQFLFFSNHDFGVSSTIEFFTEKKKLRKFSKQYLKSSDYFTAVFKVNGINRTDTNLETIMVVSLQ